MAVKVGIAMGIPFALGEVVLLLEALLVRDWRGLQLLAHLPLLLLLGLGWAVPESVRWLVARGRTQEARDIVRSAARENRRPLPAHLLAAGAGAEVGGVAGAETASLGDLFRPGQMLGRTLNMCFQVPVSVVSRTR